MIEWLKVFGLGFFNGRLAARSGKLGFVSVVLSIALSFAFFMFGFMAADTVPFSSHYDNADGFGDFLHAAFSSDVKVEICNGFAKSDSVINTYTDQADRERYALNGYHLIVDTRKSDTLIEFTQVAVDGDTELDYPSYLALSDRERQRYTLETRYTADELVLTAERVERCESYLDGLSAEGEKKDVAEAYAALKASELSAAEYAKEVYYLYVDSYYTDFESSLMSAKAPVLCDYYYVNYIMGSNRNYICLLDDICTGSFTTNADIPATFTGYYTGCENGTLSANNIDRFVKDVFYSSVSYSMSSYFTGAMQMAPAYILIPVVAAAVLFIVGKATKRRFTSKFGECYKTVNTFAWFSALLTGLTTFILGFFVYSRNLYLYMPLIFAIIAVLRTAVFFITGSLAERRADECDELSGGDAVPSTV